MDPAGLPLPLVQIGLFVMVSISVGSALLVWHMKRAEVFRLEARLNRVATLGGRRTVEGTGDNKRRRIVEDALHEIQAKEKKGPGRRSIRPTLIGRMRQAGLSWTRYTYITMSAMIAVITYIVALGWIDLGVPLSMGVAISAGLLVPHLIVHQLRERRMRAFSSEFPNALDTVVRGVQAGLGLGDCLRIISTEAQEPVRSEFAGIVHDQKIGVPLDEAMERLAVRVPLPEANFFAIVIAIQNRTGGNLAEALSNLSKVLRDRKAVRAKIKALSAEAKASAMIIGAMPLGVAALLYLTSPDYLSLLFTTSTGHMALGASTFLMGLGTVIMRKMINFDF